MKNWLDWSKPITWMVAGIVIVVVGICIASFGGNGEAGNPVAVVGAVFFLIGAFTAAVRRGLRSGREDS